MSENMKMYEALGISNEVYTFGEKILEELKERFDMIDRVAEYNQLKVVKAMQDAKVSEACLSGTTGYGYNDLGRDTLEEVYANIFHTQDALVRPQITCGTHALALALMSNLRPGDELLSPVGKPYDTLEEVIGIRPSRGSLAEYGVTYRQVDLCRMEALIMTISVKRLMTRHVRLRYSVPKDTRPDRLCQSKELASSLHLLRNQTGCYLYGRQLLRRIRRNDGAVQAGADMVVGSLIKNPEGVWLLRVVISLEPKNVAMPVA